MRFLLALLLTATSVLAETPTPRPTPTLEMVTVEGGKLPSASELAGQFVATFSIAQCEVTWDEWKRVRAWAVARGYDLDGIGESNSENHPVTEVNWHDCVKWCNAKSEMEGLKSVYQVVGETYRTGQSHPAIVVGANGYRLPSEAEWEWAARGGVNTHGYTYSGSNDLNAVGWFNENSSDGTKAVAQKQTNELGLYDMSGNVWEWCFDSYKSPHPSSPSRSLPESRRCVRGGSWFAFGPGYCSVADRSFNGNPGGRDGYVGFRPARSLGN